MTMDGALAIHKQAMVPCMEYGDFLFDSAPPNKVRKLQVQQNNSLRICTRTKVGDVSVNYLHRKCKVERLEPRRKRHLLCLIYRHASIPGNLLPSLNRTRGDGKKRIKVERPKREKYRRNPLYRGVMMWEELDVDTQMLESIHLFQNKLKKTVL